MWAVYMLVGALTCRAWQVCRLAMWENDQEDAADESWDSIMDLQRGQGRVA